jgi:hypothetical protein
MKSAWRINWRPQALLCHMLRRRARRTKSANVPILIWTGGKSWRSGTQWPGGWANLCAAKPKFDGFLMRLGQVNTHPRRRRTRVAAVSSRTCARPSDIGARLFSIPATAQCHINFICIVEREEKVRQTFNGGRAHSHTGRRNVVSGLEFFLFVSIHCTRA